MTAGPNRRAECSGLFARFEGGIDQVHRRAHHPCGLGEGKAVVDHRDFLRLHDVAEPVDLQSARQSVSLILLISRPGLIVEQSRLHHIEKDKVDRLAVLILEAFTLECLERLGEVDRHRFDISGAGRRGEREYERECRQ